MFVKRLKTGKGHFSDHAVICGALPARSSGSLAIGSDHPFGFEKGGVLLFGPRDMLVAPVFQEMAVWRYRGGPASSRFRPELQLRDKGGQFPIHRNGLLDGHKMAGILDGHPPAAANVVFKVGAVFRRRQSVI